MKVQVDDKMFLQIQAEKNAYLKVIAQELIAIRKLVENYVNK